MWPIFSLRVLFPRPHLLHNEDLYNERLSEMNSFPLPWFHKPTPPTAVQYKCCYTRCMKALGCLLSSVVGPCITFFFLITVTKYPTQLKKEVKKSLKKRLFWLSVCGNYQTWWQEFYMADHISPAIQNRQMTVKAILDFSFSLIWRP